MLCQNPFGIIRGLLFLFPVRLLSFKHPLFFFRFCVRKIVLHYALLFKLFFCSFSMKPLHFLCQVEKFYLLSGFVCYVYEWNIKPKLLNWVFERNVHFVRFHSISFCILFDFLLLFYSIFSWKR